MYWFRRQERMHTVELREQLEVSEKLMREVSKTWDEKLRETELVHRERQEALTRMGISVEAGGIGVDKSRHYLVNLNQDPALNELLLYYLKVSLLCSTRLDSSPLSIFCFHSHAHIAIIRMTIIRDDDN